MEFTRDSGIYGRLLVLNLLERTYGNLKVAYRSTGQWHLLVLARAEFSELTVLNGLLLWSARTDT
jgi:hypothetical protein